eukprot:TRINITY_DN12156_c0_g1_i1.p1 TRINITY_DN12156_c0_g1~~TRINITY_DN12156_c0_g1_i1.p1  ORF type:complete len:396 (+),score=112.85 TRINITY_DN12156_c0_g1_i1:254-1441(+)
MAGFLRKEGSRTAAQVAEELLLTVYGRSKELATFSQAACDRGRLLHADAVGVVNFLSLYHYYDKPRVFAEKARDLVHRVHDVLGRGRVLKKGEEPPRLGEATDENPLLGGLRTGKVMGENRPAGDGQQWYATVMWAFSLNRLAVALDDPYYNTLAAQLLIVSGIKFLQKTIPAGDEAVPVSSIYTLATRMSIDLSQALPGQHRASDTLIGALVVGIVLNGMGPNADAQIRKSLEGIEKRLTRMWEGTSPEEIEKLRSDPMQVGDLLMAAAWGERRSWSKDVTDMSLDALKCLTMSLPGMPLAQRFPPGELWMLSGLRNIEPSALPTEVNEAAQELLKFHGPRISMWGTMGSAYYIPASFGGCYQPRWIPSCKGYAYQQRNDPSMYQGNVDRVGDV